MFDWNDEELTNIIWGEAGDSDDHIVPYQEGSENYKDKKERNQEDTTFKPTERKTTGPKTDLHDKKLESSSNINSYEASSTSEFGMCSWSDLSNAAKTDKNPLVKAELNKDPAIFQNSDEVKDEDDFVDYSWANIGSFDDLDQMFSNDDPIFGNESRDNADMLWSSSKDITSSPLKSFPLSEDIPSLELGGLENPLSGDTPSLELGALKNTSDHRQVKLDFDQQHDQLFSLSHEKMNNPPLSLQNTHGIGDHVDYPGGKSKPMVKEQLMQTGSDIGRNTTLSNTSVVADNAVTDKQYRQKSLSKGCKRLGERSEEKMVQDFCGAWSPAGSQAIKYDQLALPVLQSSPTSSLSIQRQQLQKSEALQYQQISNSHLPPSLFGNITNSYPPMPLLSQVQSGDLKHQPVLSGHEVSPGKTNVISQEAGLVKPLTMTPQEKIEKLRRRQQMQAILAIQKQQQQLNQKNVQEKQVQVVDGADLEVEDLSSLPSFNLNSPLEQDDSNTFNLTSESYSVEDTVLYRLQDVIAKLDVKIRLCIRDSLFRLAQSAVQRHYAYDTSSTNKTSKDQSDALLKAETNSCSRYARMHDAETETNPIDRTVAHLLFHRPMELSGKISETPESPASSKIPHEHSSIDGSNFRMGFTSESTKITQNYSHKEPCPVPEPQQVDKLKTSTCVDTSENASNYGTAESEAADV